MTPITASSQLLPTGEPRFRHCTAVAPKPPLTPFDQAKIAPFTTAAATSWLRDCRSDANYAGQRVPYPNRHPVKSP
jgi:hypothetical protein